MRDGGQLTRHIKLVLFRNRECLLGLEADKRITYDECSCTHTHGLLQCLKDYCNYSSTLTESLTREHKTELDIWASMENQVDYERFEIST